MQLRDSANVQALLGLCCRRGKKGVIVLMKEGRGQRRVRVYNRLIINNMCADK